MKLTSVTLMIVLSGLLSSCSPTLFFPDRVATPGFTRSGQGYVNGSIKPQLGSLTDSLSRTRGSGASAAVDLGYAVSDHVMVIGAYRALNNRSVSEDDVYDGIGGIFSGNRYEVGARYFSGEKNGFMYELLGGVGFGYIDRRSRSTPLYNFNSNYNTYFAQAGFGGNWDYFRISTGVRLAVHDITSFSSPSPSLRYDIASDNERKHDVLRQVFVFGTPYIDLEFGYKFLFLNLQQGMPLQLSRGLVSGAPYYMSIGLSVRLGPDTWKNNSNNKTINE